MSKYGFLLFAVTLFLYSCGSEPKQGCTNSSAVNYDDEAEEDDGSCVFSGCTDATANNYNSSAGVDDGSCTYTIFGCTLVRAENYDPDATDDDGSCEIIGCMDPNADNYDAEATINSGLCEFPRFFRLRSLSNAEANDTTRIVSWAFQILDRDNFGVVPCGPTPDDKCVIPRITTDGDGDFIVTQGSNAISTEAQADFIPDEIPFEIKTLLLVDISFSVDGLVGSIKDAAAELVNNKLDNQTIAVYTFDTDTALVIDFSDDADAIIAAINDSIPETDLVASTNLWGATNDVLNVLDNSTFTEDGIVSSNLIIFTDGKHTFTDPYTAELSNAKFKLGSRDAFIVALESSGDFLPDGRIDALEFLSQDDTKLLSTANVEALGDEFVKVQEQISSLANSLYFLRYTTPLGSGNNVGLKIEIKGNGNLEFDNSITTSFSIKTKP